jgi:hypothetical protein
LRAIRQAAEPLGFPADGGQAHAATVVFAHEADLLAPALHGQLDPPVCGLAPGASLVLRLDTVSHGVADGLQQRSLYGEQHVGIQANLAAAGLELGLLVEAHRRIARSALEHAEHARDRDQT